MIFVKALFSIFCCALVCGQEITTPSPEELKLKLTFGVDLGLPIEYDIPEDATTPYLVETRDGYPFEKYDVVTEDGYILGLHRIPYSKKLKNKRSRKPVVFLMHGLLCSSSVYVINGPNVSLAYELSDRGYDVYMGNARGNTYSKRHVSLSPNDPKFWIFDWNEIAIYDLPAMINFALKKSKARNLQYIGHSQGGTVHLVLNSVNPRFRRKISSAHLLAPGCVMSNTDSPVFKGMAPIFGQPNEYASQTGFDVQPTNETIDLLGQQACLQESEDKSICQNLVFLITGYYTNNLVQSNINEILKTVPSGSSVRQLLHFSQVVQSKTFGQFNFGEEQNVQKYGTSTPPDYPLKKIKVPTYFYYSENDIIISTTDIDICASMMSRKAMKGKRLVSLKTFTHMDFVWGNKTVSRKYLYKNLFKDLRRAGR
ncbi:LIPA family protein [Megaselia abdita]